MTEHRAFSELRTHDVLWAINRVLFHPRGFALALHMPIHEQSGQFGEPYGWSLLGDGTEIWQYGETIEEDEALRNFEGFLDQHRPDMDEACGYRYPDESFCGQGEASIVHAPVPGSEGGHEYAKMVYRVT